MRLIHAALAATVCLAVTACGQNADAEGDAAEPAADAATEAAEPATDAAADAGAADAPAMMSTADASPDAATLGDANAEVTIIEYASVTCPHCATFHETLFPHIKENWIDTGRAKLVMRPLPTQPAQLAVAGFLLASCAGEGEDYFEVLDALFTTQDAMFAAAQDGTIQAYFEGVGADHGVTPEAFEMCLGDEARLAQINASMLASDADMVTGTPSFVINGTPHGADELATPESWDAALQAAEDAQ